MPSRTYAQYDSTKIAPRIRILLDNLESTSNAYCQEEEGLLGCYTSSSEFGQARGCGVGAQVDRQIPPVQTLMVPPRQREVEPNLGLDGVKSRYCQDS